MTLKSRISALEAAGAGCGRIIVAIGPAALDLTAQIYAHGIDLRAADTLVLVRKPVASPVSISVDGQPY